MGMVIKDGRVKYPTKLVVTFEPEERARYVPLYKKGQAIMLLRSKILMPLAIEDVERSKHGTHMIKVGGEILTAVWWWT